MEQLHSSFGADKQKQQQLDSPYVKYLRKPTTGGNSSPQVDSDDDSDDSDDDEPLPTTHEFTLSASKQIKALAFHPSGSRLYASTTDALLYSFDFGSLTLNQTSPSHTYEPYESHAIHTLRISQRGLILPLVADSQFKLLSPDGETLKEFRRGDMYLFDSKQTRGHTDSITDGQFLDEKTLATCSMDSTIRVWDCDAAKQSTVVVVKSKGKKTKLSKMCVIDGKIIVADGKRFTVWDSKTKMLRPVGEHEENDTITDIVNVRGSLLVRTSTSLKLYDLSNLARPTMQRLNFASYQSSPLIQNGDYITTTVMNNGTCELHILDKSDLMTIATITSTHKVTSLAWNHQINQIAYGDTAGIITILFNPDVSQGGVMTTISNRLKKRHMDDTALTTNVKTLAYNMDELAELNRSKKPKRDDSKKEEKLIWGKRKNPLESHHNLSS